MEWKEQLVSDLRTIWDEFHRLKIDPIVFYYYAGIPFVDTQRLTRTDRMSEATSTYAALFYHLGVVSADPRNLPRVGNAKENRTWSDQEYEAWVQLQYTPFKDLSPEMIGLLSTTILSYSRGDLIGLVNVLLESVASMPPGERHEFISEHLPSIQRLAELTSIFTQPAAKRENLLRILSKGAE